MSVEDLLDESKKLKFVKAGNIYPPFLMNKTLYSKALDEIAACNFVTRV